MGHNDWGGNEHTLHLPSQVKLFTDPEKGSLL